MFTAPTTTRDIHIVRTNAEAVLPGALKLSHSAIQINSTTPPQPATDCHLPTMAAATTSQDTCAARNINASNIQCAILKGAWLSFERKPPKLQSLHTVLTQYTLATTPYGKLPAAADGSHDPQAALHVATGLLTATQMLHARVTTANALDTHPALQAVLVSGMLTSSETLAVGACSVAMRKFSIRSICSIAQTATAYEEEDPLALNCDPVVRFGMWAFVNRDRLRNVRSLSVQNLRSAGVTILLGALALSSCPLEEISGELAHPSGDLADEVIALLCKADPELQLEMEHTFGAPVFLWATSEQGRLVMPQRGPTLDGPVFEGDASTLCGDFAQLQRGTVAHATRVLPGLIQSKADTLQRVFADSSLALYDNQSAILHEMYVATPLAFHCEHLRHADFMMPLGLGGPTRGSTLLAVANRRSICHASVSIECDMQEMEAEGAATWGSVHLLHSALEVSCGQADVRAALQDPAGHAGPALQGAFCPKVGSLMHPLSWLSGLESLCVSLDIEAYPAEPMDETPGVSGTALLLAAVECVAQCIRDNASTLTTVRVNCLESCIEAYAGEEGILAALAGCCRLECLELSLRPRALDVAEIAETRHGLDSGDLQLDELRLMELQTSWLLSPSARRQAAADGANYLRRILQGNAATLKKLDLVLLDGDACVAILQAAPKLQQVQELVLHAAGMFGDLDYALGEVSNAGGSISAALYTAIEFHTPALGAPSQADVPALALLPSFPHVATTGAVATGAALTAHCMQVTAAWLAAMQGVHHMTGVRDAMLSHPAAWAERAKHWPAGADVEASHLEYLELHALVPSAAAGNLRRLRLDGMNWTQAAALQALQEITAAGADCIQEVKLSMPRSGGSMLGSAATQHIDVAAVNASLCQLRRLKHFGLRQSIQVPQTDPSGPSLLRDLKFYGGNCELSFEGLMTPADMIALARLLHPAAQAPSTWFKALRLCTGSRLEQEVAPNQDLFERMWAALGAAPCMHTLTDLYLNLPSHAFGCPSALHALQQLHHLQDVNVTPSAGELSSTMVEEGGELEADEDDVRERAYTANLSWLGRAVGCTPPATLGAAMKTLYENEAHSLDGSGNNARMSKRMQVMAAVGHATAPAGAHLQLFALLQRLAEEWEEPADLEAYCSNASRFLFDLAWTAQHMLDAVPAAPEGACPPAQAEAYFRRQRNAAEQALLYLQEVFAPAVAAGGDITEADMRTCANVLLAHCSNAACAALPSAVLQCAAQGYWPQMTDLNICTPIAGRLELLHWAQAMCPSIGVRGIQTQAIAHSSDWKGGQGGSDAMGYGAAMAFPAPNLDVMLPQGHATPVQDAADCMDIYPEHVEWFRTVAPMAGWGRDDLVSDFATDCNEGNNFGAKHSLEELLYNSKLMETPVLNCFGSDFDLQPLIYTDDGKDNHRRAARAAYADSDSDSDAGSDAWGDSDGKSDSSGF